VISVGNRKFFPPTVNFASPPWGFPLDCVSEQGVKNYSDGATGPSKKFDDIFDLVDTIHQRVSQTGGQAPDDSKDRAYA